MTEGEERIRPLGRDELDKAIDWAAAEGWNPGLADADAFWAADPEGFLGIEVGGELVGTGSIISYEGEFGFLGLFIVPPEHRGKGFGRELWAEMVDRLRERLGPGAAIGLDGVYEMQETYAAGGFVLSHRNVRLEGTGADAVSDPDLVPLTSLPFEQVAEFDRAHFGFEREAFLRHWIDPNGGLGLGLLGDRGMRAMGVIRPCRSGFKVGPLFAEDGESAERVFAGLQRVAIGEPVLLDIPEVNPGAAELGGRHGMREVFGCARMYLGRAPDLRWDRIYGVTTFELG
jgi:GNAT superfamily N-acetyltransferase